MPDIGDDKDQAPANALLIAAAPELLAALEGLTADLSGLISDSYGVTGLHLNGDVAPWGELLPGGRFEDWLFSIDAARAAIAKARGETP